MPWWMIVPQFSAEFITFLRANCQPDHNAWQKDPVKQMQMLLLACMVALLNYFFFMKVQFVVIHSVSALQKGRSTWSLLQVQTLQSSTVVLITASQCSQDTSGACRKRCCELPDGQTAGWFQLYHRWGQRESSTASHVTALATSDLPITNSCGY